MSNINPGSNSWIDGYNAQQEAIAQYYGAKADTSPEPKERDSLNRLQLLLIWFASVLIAVTIYSQITTRF